MSTHSATAQPQSPDMTHNIHKLAFGERLQVRATNKTENESRGLLAYWFQSASSPFFFFVPLSLAQVQNVKGAFNALGGADRLASNRKYASRAFFADK